MPALIGRDNVATNAGGTRSSHFSRYARVISGWTRTVGIPSAL